MKKLVIVALMSVVLLTLAGCAKDSVVTLTAADHPPVTTPDLSGLDRGQAETTLTAVGLVLGEVTESYDVSALAGTVASQTPAAGTETPKGSAVALVLSKGPAPVAIPQVVGMTQAEAAKSLEAAGFTVTVEQKDDKAAKDSVISQAPSVGTALPGTTVVLTVSTGGEPKPVPVLGQSPNADTEGFGTIRPILVHGGGDPTSAVSDITWSSWGGAQAVGYGTTIRFDGTTVAGSPRVTTTIVGWDLGMYKGHYMYRKVGWYFPQYGETFDTIASAPYISWE